MLIIFRRNYVRTFDLHSWFDRPFKACDGNFIGYGNEFVRLKFVKYNDHTGSFQLPCESGKPKYWFYRGYQGTPYTDWLSKMETAYFELTEDIHTRVTMVVRRNEAHNLYHTMCEFYNIFLVIKQFQLNPKEVDILFMDSRPPSILDSTWEKLFGRILHHDVVSSQTIFRDLIWIPIGYESPMNFHFIREIPYIEEFHKFFIQSIGIPSTKPLNCANLNYTLILRHDYVSHPERQTLFQGKIHRKIANEEDVLQYIQRSIGPNHHIKGVVLEDMSMREQVELFSKTDVLIGMHGAGLTHIIALPPHATVLELFPYSYRRRLAYYFHAITLWRGLRYVSWTNDISDNDIDGFNTRISLPAISHQVRQIRDTMCPGSS